MSGTSRRDGGRAFALMDYGVHWFDLAEFVTGSAFTEITAHSIRTGRSEYGRVRRVRAPNLRPKALPGGRVDVDVPLEDQAD